MGIKVKSYPLHQPPEGSCGLSPGSSHQTGSVFTGVSEDLRCNSGSFELGIQSSKSAVFNYIDIRLIQSIFCRKILRSFVTKYNLYYSYINMFRILRFSSFSPSSPPGKKTSEGFYNFAIVYTFKYL